MNVLFTALTGGQGVTERRRPADRRDGIAARRRAVKVFAGRRKRAKTGLVLRVWDSFQSNTVLICAESLNMSQKYCAYSLYCVHTSIIGKTSFLQLNHECVVSGALLHPKVRTTKLQPSLRV